MQILPAELAAREAGPACFAPRRPRARRLRAALLAAAILAGLSAALAPQPGPAALAALMLLGAALGLALRARRPRGWFVRSGRGAVAVRLDAQRALLLDDAELVTVRALDELWALPDRRGHLERCPFTFLDVQLSHTRCAELIDALRETAAASAVRRARFAPVSVPQSGVLRLVWSGPGWQIEPGVEPALEVLTAHTSAARARRPTGTPWQELSDEQLAIHLLSLYDAGDVRAAQQILQEQGRSASRAAPPLPTRPGAPRA